jgi:hypothetical protein
MTIPENPNASGGRVAPLAESPASSATAGSFAPFVFTPKSFLPKAVEGCVLFALFIVAGFAACVLCLLDPGIRRKYF